MSEYKRLTAQKEDRYWEKEEFWQSAEEPSYEEIEELYSRLAELEDKIESGRLVELPFAVIDKQTKKEADEYEISLKEDWAKCLCYCDLDGFAITQDGNLILLDECGKYTYCPCDRFEIKAEARLKELQEGNK